MGPVPTFEDIAEPTPPPLLPLSRHLAALFPSLASAAAAAAAASSADAGADAEAAPAPAPALVVVLGGQCRADKFVVLDRLLEEVRFIAALLSLSPSSSPFSSPSISPPLTLTPHPLRPSPLQSRGNSPSPSLSPPGAPPSPTPH